VPLHRGITAFAFLATVAFIAIVVGFFLPPIILELDFFAASPVKAGLLYPPIHATAALLAIVTWWNLLRQSSPGRIQVAIALAAIVACVSPLAMLIYAIGFADGAAQHMMTALVLILTILAVMVFAWRQQPWSRWFAVLSAYAIAVAYYGWPPLMIMFNVLSGGLLFIAANAILLLCAIYGVAAARQIQSP
jgi:hypothetical protein